MKDQLTRELFEEAVRSGACERSDEGFFFIIEPHETEQEWKDRFLAHAVEERLNYNSQRLTIINREKKI